MSNYAIGMSSKPTPLSPTRYCFTPSVGMTKTSIPTSLRRRNPGQIRRENSLSQMSNAKSIVAGSSMRITHKFAHVMLSLLHEMRPKNFSFDHSSSIENRINLFIISMLDQVLANQIPNFQPSKQPCTTVNKAS
jgi:hypothetical protein